MRDVLAVSKCIVRALCVGRHAFLSEHLCVFFRDVGLETTGVVGLDKALAAASESVPDVVICDYDLLGASSLDPWERDVRLAKVPVIAVSLTRRPDEVNLLDVNGVAAFFYLPQLDRENAMRVIGAGDRPVVPPPTAYERPSPQSHSRTL